MKQIFSPEGWRRLRASWILLAASAVTAVAFVGGTQWYLEKEMRDTESGSRRMKDATTRLDNIRRERDTLEQSVELFRVLLARGLMQPERRLDLVELVNRMRTRHHILSVDYEIAPQRALALPGGRTFPAIEILSSRVSLRVRALHEGDLIAFVQALGETSQGFHPVDRCQLRRQEVASADALQARVEAECTLEWITVREKRNA